jgi:hypothetical protein
LQLGTKTKRRDKTNKQCVEFEAGILGCVPNTAKTILLYHYKLTPRISREQKRLAFASRVRAAHELDALVSHAHRHVAPQPNVAAFLLLGARAPIRPKALGTLAVLTQLMLLAV